MSRPRKALPGPRLELLEAAPEWLTRPQAAEIAGRTTRTIDRWREEGRLATCRLEDGSERWPILVSRKSLAALLPAAQSDR